MHSEGHAHNCTKSEAYLRLIHADNMAKSVTMLLSSNLLLYQLQGPACTRENWIPKLGRFPGEGKRFWAWKIR